MNPAYAAVARRALDLVPDNSRIGLGSGRTTTVFIELLAERVRQGLRVLCVPTSQATADLAVRLGLTLVGLDEDEPLALTVDGADEVERSTLHVIKGWGAALVRERIVAAASRQQVLIVTPEKLVDHLGQRGRLPVEVVPFAEPFCRRQIARLAVPGGIQPQLRGGAQPLVTDNGNWILDCAIGPLHDPAAVERELCTIPGVVDTGLFLGTAAMVLVATEDQVVEIKRS
jgi:ribose 5-phosphate isomerase A